MPEGGFLSVKSGVNERSVFFELADTGGGIPPDLDVFQVFATTKSGAMGLGLTITRHIVESHDGTITYGSQPGEGTTFCLTFPWVPEARESVRLELKTDTTVIERGAKSDQPSAVGKLRLRAHRPELVRA